MGQPKLLLPWGKVTIIEQTVENVVKAGIPEVIVVLGCMAEEMEKKLAKHPVKTVVNRDYKNGMSSSFICGLKAMRGDVQGVMLVLGDQP